MLENIGFAWGGDALRHRQCPAGAPTTGMPTAGVPGDMVQVKRGRTGITRSSPSARLAQEMFDHTVLAFNLAEKFRTPFSSWRTLSSATCARRCHPGSGKNRDREPQAPEPGATPGDPGFLDENVAPMPIFGRGSKPMSPAPATTSTEEEPGRCLGLDHFVRSSATRFSAQGRDRQSGKEGRERGGRAGFYGAVSRRAMAALRAKEQGLRSDLRLITAGRSRRRRSKKCRRPPEGHRPGKQPGQLFPYIKAAADCHAEVSFMPRG